MTPVNLAGWLNVVHQPYTLFVTLSTPPFHIYRPDAKLFCSHVCFIPLCPSRFLQSFLSENITAFIPGGLLSEETGRSPNGHFPLQQRGHHSSDDRLIFRWATTALFCLLVCSPKLCIHPWIWQKPLLGNHELLFALTFVPVATQQPLWFWVNYLWSCLTDKFPSG